MSGDKESSSAIISTVEKAELMSAVGREIERIDRQSTSNGYTSWALWAALGVVGWKVVEVMKSGNFSGFATFYAFFMTCLISAQMAAKWASTKVGGSAREPYFKTPDVNMAGVLSFIIFAIVSLVGAWVVIDVGAVGIGRYVALSFYLIPLFLGCLFFFVPKFPVSDAKAEKGPQRVGIWIAAGLSVLGLCTLFVLGSCMDWSKVVKPNDSVVLGLLLSIMTVLIIRLVRNIHAEERRALFQRLETEMMLSKIDVVEAKSRYENLMLGMNVSAAIRPWVDAVMLPMDTANSGLSEVRQLLARFDEAKETAMQVAILQRVKTLLGGVDEALQDSGRAITKLRSVCYAVFGEKDMGASPISVEAERILEAHKKVRENYGEVRRFVDRLTS